MSSVSEFPPKHLVSSEEDKDHHASSQSGERLGLPAPGDGSQGHMNEAIKFDALGPMIVSEKRGWNSAHLLRSTRMAHCLASTTGIL